MLEPGREPGEGMRATILGVRDRQKAEKPVPGTQGDLREKLVATASNRSIRRKDEGNAWQNRGVTAEGSDAGARSGRRESVRRRGRAVKRQGKPERKAATLGPRSDTAMAGEATTVVRKRCAVEAGRSVGNRRASQQATER